MEMAGAQLLFGNGGRPALMAHHRLMTANRGQACAKLQVQALTVKLHERWHLPDGHYGAVALVTVPLQLLEQQEQLRRKVEQLARGRVELVSLSFQCE